MLTREQPQLPTAQQREIQRRQEEEKKKRDVSAFPSE